MTDLAAQILAALDRAEETAQAASNPPWTALTMFPTRSEVTNETEIDGGVIVSTPRKDDFDVAHIATWDPAHVLRLTTALREVASNCLEQLAMNTPPSAVNSEVVWLAEDTLRALASVWDVPGDNT